ncbi:Histidine kinase [Rubrivivax sp. A210]|uniref:putative bifunctional diguanylate cyclase/phosphodiesterase n=1 Tax=Rubrivivax sp. A210 TaxID=2772301 RepID=UPI00191B4F2B|nr:EAL domain-containing protein [Rubrivivax sp. A210]CAD5374732.1 Histidine kinase [Rubrivivax sp. A210]
MTQDQAAADEGLPAQPEVLLVDDDPVNLMLTAQALRERGFRIFEADSGERALQMLRDWTPDLVVLDAMMPGLDGFDTCAELRRRPGWENTPVLMLTGLDDDASITRAYQVGATDFFVKATQWGLLAGRLRYLLRASRTRLELERNRAKLARAQDLARMGSFDWRRSRHGVLMSPEALRVFGFGPSEPLALRALMRMVPQEGRRALSKEMHRALRHASVLAADVPVVLLDGRQRIVHVEAEPEFSEHGHSIGYSGIVQDVTDRRQAEDRIHRLANFDELTGLPNRRQLLWRAERALEQARRLQHHFALLLIDLDRFKIINDTLGHWAGDELLHEVGRRLRACVRHSDQVMDGMLEAAGARSHRALETVGRLGGDEFVALLPEVASDRDAKRVADRILEALREPIVISGQERFVTASVGVAVFPRDGNSVVDLLRNADVAMYAAKEQGKDSTAIYSPQLLSGRARDALELETALHRAIERNELVLHYQPKIDVRSSRMMGVEALMRWQRGNELVMPGQFIKVAEETGLIVPMSYWALGEAARQAHAWKQAFGFDDAIAVNLPARMFERSDLVECIHQYCANADVPPRAIQLEIIEGSLMRDIEAVIPSLHRLYQIGVEIAIDDFGTGYSSLAYLTQLPISELKIDKGFVKDIGTSAQNLAVVQAIIALGRSLGLRVVAEGVETLRQEDELRKADCRFMQGFLFSRALPAGELQRWHEQTVLPSATPWMGASREGEFPDDGLRATGRRPYH